jgi:hypothetical protein
MALDDTGVPRLCEPGDDGVEVAFEVLGEAAETGQLAGSGGRSDPCRQLVPLQVGEHVDEGAHVLGECGQFGTGGQDGLELEPVAFGQGVGVGEDPPGDSAGRWRPGPNRLRLAAQGPADVATDVAVAVRLALLPDLLPQSPGVLAACPPPLIEVRLVGVESRRAALPLPGEQLLRGGGARETQDGVEGHAELPATDRLL